MMKHPLRKLRKPVVNSILGGGIASLDIMPRQVHSIPPLGFIIRIVSALPPLVNGGYFHNGESIAPIASEVEGVKL